jgi:two-component system response regulator
MQNTENAQVEILLVEDNPSDAEMAIRALQRGDARKKLIHLSDGEEALNFIFCQDDFSARDFNMKPKVILLDLKMPRVDGIEVLKKIKSDPRTQTIPVVMLTSSKEDSDIKECYKLGANSYVVKPMEFEEFNKTVYELGIYWVSLNQY